MVKKIKKAIKKYGFPGIFQFIYKEKIIRKLRHFWRHYFRNKNIVFKYNSKDISKYPLNDIVLHRYESVEEMPEDIILLLLKREEEKNSNYWPLMERYFNDDCILWLSIINDDVAGIQWSRKGKYIDNWYIPLEEEDIIIFNDYVFEKWRGRRISPTMKHHLIHQETKNGGCAYLDIGIWNKVALKAAPRGGFTEKIKIVKPLPMPDFSKAKKTNFYPGLNK